MILLLMRHGIAEPLSTLGGDDADRPLSLKGRDRTARVARGLLQSVPSIDLLASSPKRRARQTADMVRDASISISRHIPKAEIWDELLLATAFEPLARRLRDSEEKTALLVGHEPNLSRFAAWMLTRDEEGIEIAFKKAGVCALEVQWNAATATWPMATLLWMAPPKILSQLVPR